MCFAFLLLSAGGCVEAKNVVSFSVYDPATHQEIGRYYHATANNTDQRVMSAKITTKDGTTIDLSGDVKSDANVQALAISEAGLDKNLGKALDSVNKLLDKVPAPGVPGDTGPTGFGPTDKSRWVDAFDPRLLPE
jgi:hypothetical protein